MKTIGVDLDDVLLNFNDSFLLFYNENYGTTYARADVTHYHVEKIWDVDQELLQERLHDFYHSEHYKNVQPVVGAIEAISKLAENNKLHIITSSPKDVKEKIHIWLETHFGESFETIHFTRKSRFDQRRDKGEMCVELGINVFIDDHPDNALAIAQKGIPVYLLDTPWNQGEMGPLVKRVYSWSEILSELGN